MSERRGNGVAWLALLVSLVALVLAWKAYRREGGVLFGGTPPPVPAKVEEPLNRLDDRLGASRDSLERQLALTEARVRLLARRAEVNVDRNLDKMSEEVAEVRENLERSYESSSDQVRARWRNTDGELKKVQEDLKRGNQKALAELDRLLAKLRQDEAEEKKEGEAPR